MIFLTDRKTADERVKSLLTEHAIRPTNQRMQIAGELLSKPQHLSADQVMARVNKKETLVSKATVYNTLNLFAEKGLIRQVIIDSGKVFYDSNTDSHHHIYNEDTGQLHDVEASRVTLEKNPELPANTVKTGIDIIIRVKNSR
ncbi:MAG TPA: transcriptional repressor [Gammaproteobacteria bacterium]|nr:transcriptional repressor [Gammaproteobacteria bacterium]